MSFSPHAAIMSSPGTIPSLLAFLASTDLIYPPRRLLLHTSIFNRPQTPPSPPPPPPPSATSPSSTRAAPPSEPSLDANVIMILAVLLCALICAIGLNSIVRCALRCFSISISSPPRPRGVRCVGGAGGVKKAVLKSIPTVAYCSPGADAAAEGKMPSWSECAICLSEFKGGERVRVIPGCNHGFHVRCVDRWLRGNATCPTCRGSCVVASQGACSGQMKAVQLPGCAGSQQADASAAAAAAAAAPPPPPPAPRPPASALSPLDREGTLVEGVLVDSLGRY